MRTDTIFLFYFCCVETFLTATLREDTLLFLINMKSKSCIIFFILKLFANSLYTDFLISR